MKNNYVKEMQQMIDKGIPDELYSKTEDNTLQKLKCFQDFLYKNFSKYEKYNDMLPILNQPVELYEQQELINLMV